MKAGDLVWATIPRVDGDVTDPPTFPGTVVRVDSPERVIVLIQLSTRVSAQVPFPLAQLRVRESEAGGV